MDVVGGLLPRDRQVQLDKMPVYASVEERSRPFAARVALGTLLLSVLLAVAAAALLGDLAVPAALAAFFIGLASGPVMAVAWLQTRIDSRKNQIERVLPDLLSMMASNVRAGLSPIVALRAAAKPEFGVLEKEIERATARSLGTTSVVDALQEMNDRIPSPLFQRAVSLISGSVRSGGELAKLLEKTAEDVRENLSLKEDLITSSNAFVYFIVFAVVLGTPLLLALAHQFTVIITSVVSTASAASGGGGFAINAPVSGDFINNAAIITIFITSILASCLVGVIREGKPISGLKWSPLLAVFGILSFIFMRDYVLNSIKP
jgi:pilus assembly protein TadC